MSIFADAIDEWSKLNTPAKIAVGGVGIAGVFLLFSMRGRVGSSTGASQGNALGSAASANPFTVPVTTPSVGPKPPKPTPAPNGKPTPAPPGPNHPITIIKKWLPPATWVQAGNNAKAAGAQVGIHPIEQGLGGGRNRPIAF